MATVSGLTADRMLAIEAESVVNGHINDSGHLILTKHDGSTIDAGAILGSVPSASDSVAGIIQLASSTEAEAGTNDTKAVTPLGLESVVGTINDALAGFQPLDTDLTSIAGLTATNNDLIQRKSGVWANRTLAQLLTDLITAGAITNMLYNGTIYALATGAVNYIGDTDPGGAAANGSVWFDTSG